MGYASVTRTFVLPLGCRISRRLASMLAAMVKLFSAWPLMYSGDSLSAFAGARLFRDPVLSIREREVVDSKRLGLLALEMYSVRRRKDTPESENLGFPRDARGRRRARSWAWTGGGCNGAWIAIDWD